MTKTWLGSGIQAICLVLLTCITSFSQQFDLLLKNGHVFDARNGIDEVMDIGIAADTIAAIEKNIDTTKARKIVDLLGYFVSAGFIDIHTHVFVGSEIGKFANGINSLSPDNFTFKAGVTTVVDAGTAGWKNFELFKKQVVDQSKTRVLSFINIAGTGMIGKPGEENLGEMKVDEISRLVRKYPEIIVGVKIGHFEQPSWAPFDLAIQACEENNLPLFVECHLPDYSLQDQLDKMRPGDIITHSFEDVADRMPVVDDDGIVRPFVFEAKERGILFDVGHGGAGFWFSQAVPAFEQGLWPNSFGTDLHRFSMNAGMKDMLNVMSKYLAIGMPLRDVLTRATWYPAKSIGRTDLGNLSPGHTADIAVIKLEEGNFGYVDAGGNRIRGTQKLQAELTIRAGQIVWDLNGLTAKPFFDEE